MSDFKVGDIVRHRDEENFIAVGPMKIFYIDWAAPSETNSGPYICRWDNGNMGDFFSEEIEHLNKEE